MGIKKAFRLSVLAATILASQMAVGATRCDVSVIEQLPVDQQMKQYSLCVSLMEKRIQLLKKEKEARKLMDEANSSSTKQHAPSSQPAPSAGAPLPPVPNPMGVMSGGEPVVSAIEGAGKKLRATLRWPDGSTALVSKGMTIKGYRILDITVDGIKAKRVKAAGYKAKKGDVVFIPVGANGLSNAGMQMPGAVSSPMPPVVYPQQ